MRVSTPVSEHHRKPLLEAVILQLLAVGFAAMILDGGKVLHAVLLAVLAHWVVSVIILIRRPTSPTKTDLMMVGRAFLLMGVVVYLLGVLVMELRGIES